MKFLIVDTYYPSFLRSFYTRRPDLASCPYAEQWQALMAQCFGTADFYSSNLVKLGHEATEVVPNCEPLQRRWAEEHDLKLGAGRWKVRLRRGVVPWLERNADDWFYPVLMAQVKHYLPDVLYIHDMNGIQPAFIRQVRPYVRLVVGQIASPVATGADFHDYDLVLSSFPHFVTRFRQQGLASEYFRLGFEPQILGRLTEVVGHRVVFIGGLTPAHSERIDFLEAVTSTQPLDVWGYGGHSLSLQSPLYKAHHGEAWALDMYSLLHSADIVLNHHINTAENYANNMRLYEATGVGAFLLTDAKDNLHTLFQPGQEVVAYRSAPECAELIGYYREHAEERRAIAQAGQQRTLHDHTYYHRMEELQEILSSRLHRSKGNG